MSHAKGERQYDHQEHGACNPSPARAGSALGGLVFYTPAHRVVRIAIIGHVGPPYGCPIDNLSHTWRVSIATWATRIAALSEWHGLIGLAEAVPSATDVGAHGT